MSELRRAERAMMAMAQVVLSKTDLHAMSWRHHGLGMLQAEFDENVRVHVWDPRLRTIRIDDPRSIHDHRFRIYSMVLAGCIIDHPCVVQLYPSAEQAPPNRDLCSAWAIRHAKIQDDTDADHELLGVATLTRLRRVIHRAGESYAIERRDWHTTEVLGPTVTLVYRHEFDEQPARVLTTFGIKPVSGIVRPETYQPTPLNLWTAGTFSDGSPASPALRDLSGPGGPAAHAKLVGEVLLDAMGALEKVGIAPRPWRL